MSKTRNARPSGTPSDWATYRRLLGYVRPYGGRLLAGFLFGLFFALCNACMVWLIKGGFREMFVQDVRGSRIVAVALLFPVLGFCRGAADFLATYYIRWVGNRVVMDLRNGMFRHLHELSVGYFSETKTGELISRTANDTTLIERAVSSVIADLAKQPLTLLGMAVWIFLVDARLAAVSLVVFPLCLLPIVTFGRRVRRFSRQSQERIADVVSILQETITGVRIVKAFGMEDYEADRFVAQSRAYFGRSMRVAKASSIVEPIIVFISTAGAAGVLIYVHVTGMAVDEFIAFAAALFMMYEPVKKLSRVQVSIQQSSGAADRVFEILDTESQVKDRPGAVAFAGEIREIAFRDVCFSYANEPVLSDVSLDVRAGERIAIVGGSGAGKTTLVNLLPRFYDVGKGAVMLNGTDIRGLTLRSLRSLMGLVTQDTFLFDDTVAGNISYGLADAPQARIEEAARRAHAHDFVMQMPEGYGTRIGERGVRLSGGQRQRLAIARAILRNPPILILDEATNALDTESERMVQDALDELMVGRTVFAIAHRLSTIANCDRIIVLERGRIVEQGSHETLLALGGLYRRLYDLQFGFMPERPDA